MSALAAEMREMALSRPLTRASGATEGFFRPCERPGRRAIPGATDPDLWLPEPCGMCQPCLARDALRASR